MVNLVGIGLLFAGGGVAMIIFVANDPVVRPQGRIWLELLFSGFVVMGVYLILSTIRSRVVLYEDRVEVVELTHTKVLRSDQIGGWRVGPTTPICYVLIPIDKSRKPVQIAQVFRMDDEFAEWLLQFPNQDADERRKAKAEIRNDSSLGDTPGERMKALSKAKRIARIVDLVTLATGVLFFLPRFYELLVWILVALPWISLELIRHYRGLFHLDDPADRARPNLAFPFLIPGLFLSLRALVGFNVIQSPNVWWSSVAITAGLCIWALRVEPSITRRKAEAFLLVVISMPYGYGVTLHGNALLDRSVPVTYSVAVHGKHKTSGRSTTYNLDLNAWGPMKLQNDLKVSTPTYNAIHPGDIVDLDLMEGALGIRWYWMRQWHRAEAR